MSRVFLSLSIVIPLLLVRLIEAQCVTSSYVPCLPDGGGSGGSDSVPADDFDNSEYWDLLGNLANDPIGKRAAPRPLLASRQNALCCKPTNQCLVVTDGNIPFCYDPDTTRFAFSDDSFGFLSNGTYYAADGTFVDFQDGYYSSADGTTGTFAPAASATAAATAAATSSDVGAAATSTTAHAAPRTTAGTLATQLSVGPSSSVSTTQHTAVTVSTNTPNVKSGSATIKRAGVIGWLGLCVACFGVLLA